jgi:hypothetical protein
MKKVLSILGIIALTSLCFTSCKKEKAKTVSEKIVGVWHLNNYVDNYHFDGTDHIESDSYGPNDTYEFSKDGILKATVQPYSDSSTYSIIGENKLSITDDKTYDIKTLDDHNLVLYFKTSDGDEYEKLTITLKR